MSTANLLEVWEAAKADPFYPTISKDFQFFVGAALLLICTYASVLNRPHSTDHPPALFLSGVFALNRSALTLTVLGLPASLAFGFVRCSTGHAIELTHG
jgi:hypothetical protein